MSIKLLPLVLLAASTFIIAQQNDNLCRFVDPFIGTGGHGHTFPGATLPFGMVQLSPDSKTNDWDRCSGYHYSDSTISGFSHTHLSGTGCGDYGDILFMPFTGDIKSDSNADYKSKFSHKNESAAPGYYSVYLDDYKVRAELTATERAGFHNYTFPGKGSACILIDMLHGIQDKCIDSKIDIINDHTIQGFRRSAGWAKDHTVYFYAEFSKPFTSFKKIIENGKLVLVFSEKDIQILSKVGISHTSIEGAKKNIEKEIPGWDFNLVKQNASVEWNKYLNKIKVEGRSDKEKKIFYTALYHTMVVPNIENDVDGNYPGMDRKIHNTNGGEMYTVFSLWDTFRAANPLYSIVLPDKFKSFVESMITKSKEVGTLPVWELASNETWCMIGSPAVPVICDAVMKGFFTKSEVNEIWKYVKPTVFGERRGLKYYREYGFIPADKDDESVSKTLEYCYEDWCAYLLSKKADPDNAVSEILHERSQYYKNLFDPYVGFFRARSNGTWKDACDPFSVSGDYTEANAWQYAFFVPQDITGLTNIYGGKKGLEDKLDSLFSAESKLRGMDQPDITGLIGQYVHGNEPSHHIAYLYDYCGMQFKTAEKVGYILNNFYNDTPDGLIGNEDCGQMSAWYILSALGFYPVTPGSNQYAIGSPLFNKAVVSLSGGKEFVIKANDASDKNYFIKSASLNATSYSKSFLYHKDLVNGGVLEFNMSPVPEKSWGSGDGNIPVSKIDKPLLLPVPIIKSSGKSFSDSMRVEIISPSGSINYCIAKDVNSNENFSAYNGPFYIDKNCVVKAFTTKPAFINSMLASAEFVKTKSGRKVTYLTHYDDEYTAGGENALIDQIRGTESFHTGGWQGFYFNDLDVIVDLGTAQDIHKLSTGFLQNVTSWILFPEQVEYLTSQDGENFSSIGIVKSKIPNDNRDILIQDFEFKPVNTNTRYIRVKAKNIGLLPSWHSSAGKKCFIFADEITIE